SAAAGAGIINDIRALQRAGALAAAVAAGLPVCILHMPGDPHRMQNHPVYGDVVTEVKDSLLVRAEACQAAGIPADQIILDPGFGFGKTLEHNLMLLAHLAELGETGYPLLVGLSRKSMLAALLGRDV